MSFYKILVVTFLSFGLLGLLDLKQVVASDSVVVDGLQTSGLQLKPILTSQDAGFFDLITFRGEIFGGTYHDDGEPALVYRIEKDVSKSSIDAWIDGAESVYVFAKDLDETTLILNTERSERDGQQTAWMRDHAGKSWSRINEDSSWTFGLGAGYGLGRLWVGNNNGDVWYSEDNGASWVKGPSVPQDRTAVGFIEFNGKLYACQLDWKNGDSHLYRLSEDKTKWEMVVMPTPPDGKRWWTLLSKRGLIWNGYLYMPGEYTDGWSKILRMDKNEKVEIVFDVKGGFVVDFALVRMADGVERLCTAWSNSWSDSANGLRSRLYCTTNGVDWEKYAEFDEPFAWGITSRGGDELFVGTMGVRNSSVKGKIYYQKF